MRGRPTLSKVSGILTSSVYRVYLICCPDFSAPGATACRFLGERITPKVNPQSNTAGEGLESRIYDVRDKEKFQKTSGLRRRAHDVSI